MPAEPSASRPYMPDYGISAADGGSGLLPWAWAQEQLNTARNFWLATRWPDGRPHVMPVWAAWDGDNLWSSGGLHSRKVQNLLDDARCAATTEDALNPVVIEGIASKVDDEGTKQTFLDLINAKYDTDYSLNARRTPLEPRTHSRSGAGATADEGAIDVAPHSTRRAAIPPRRTAATGRRSP